MCKKSFLCRFIRCNDRDLHDLANLKCWETKVVLELRRVGTVQRVYGDMTWIKVSMNEGLANVLLALYFEAFRPFFQAVYADFFMCRLRGDVDTKYV